MTKMKYSFGENSKSIEKYVGNPFVNTKEDYYNEIVQKIICSILLSKNIKKIDYLIFDLLFDFFLKRIKSIGTNCKKLASLRSSAAANYIDIKFCLKLHFPPLYKEIYTSKKINIFNSFSIDKEKVNTNPHNSINVVHNSYLYHKQLCMKQNEKNDFLNEFNSMDCFYSKNNLPFDLFNANKDVNVLFLNENINVHKYKELMKLKKKYIHDHMPIIPLTINMKEKKIGYIDSTEAQEDVPSSSNSDEEDDEEGEEEDEEDDDDNSSTSSNNNVSGSSVADSFSSDISAHSKKPINKVGTHNKGKTYTDENTSKEKIELLTLLPKLKEIYAQRSRSRNDPTQVEHDRCNSLNSFEML